MHRRGHEHSEVDVDCLNCRREGMSRNQMAARTASGSFEETGKAGGGQIGWSLENKRHTDAEQRCRACSRPTPIRQRLDDLDMDRGGSTLE